MLKIDHVTKVFVGLHAVEDVSFEVRTHEAVGVIGPNGAGKTTLFNLITGYVRPTSGTIFFDGVNTTNFAPEDLCGRGLTRTFQVVKPFGNLTTLENVMIGAFARCSSRREAVDRAREVVAFTELSEYSDALAKNLPLAGRKRLELARALATQPKLLLLDEVLAGLNPSEIGQALHLLDEVRNRGITLVIIEHNMKVISRLSDRVVALHHGRKVTEGSPDEVFSHGEVLSAYLGRETS